MKSLNAGFVAFGTLAVLLITIIAAMSHSFGSMFLLDMERTAEMVRVSDANTITFGDLKQLKKEADAEKISGYSEMIALVSNKAGVRKDGTKIVMIDEDFPSVYKYELIAGGFPDADLLRKGKAYAVISDQLALGLFMSIDVVGNEIEIMGDKFTVSGVYKSKGSIFWKLSGDGFDRVFIPYTSIDGCMEIPVDILALLRKQNHPITDVKARIDAITGQKASSYEIYDHMTSLVVSRQYFDLLIFIVGIAAISFTLAFLTKCAVCVIRLYKKQSSIYYTKDLLKADFRRILGILSLFLISAAGIVLIFHMIRFRFIIADKYIPEDNIFDMQFYVNAAIKDSIKANSYKINVRSMIVHYQKSVMYINIFCSLLISVFIIISTMLYNLLLQSGAEIKNILSAVAIIILAGGASGVAAAVLLGFGAYLHVKGWLVVFCYLLAILLSRKFYTQFVSVESGSLFYASRRIC